MRRREFIALLGSTAAVWPLTAHAEQRKTPTIGVLVVGSPGSEQFWHLFQKAMRDLGYVEGQSVRYEFRSDQGQGSRLPELAAELVRLKVDLIVTWFTPAAQAAKQATREIPIVMALAGDPVGTGLIESLNRPGGNVTGMAGVTAELAGKSVEVIRELLPSAHRVVALANAPDPFSKPFSGRNYDEAIRLSREGIRQRSDFVGAHRVLTAAAGIAGQTDIARVALQELRRAQPNISLAWIASQMPIKLDAEREHYLEGFRRAGLD